MTLLLDLAFIPKATKPVTDQELEETQRKSIQEESIPVTTGNNNVIFLMIYYIMSLIVTTRVYTNIRVKRSIKRLS